MSGLIKTTSCIGLFFCALCLLSGCESADVELMKTGLVRSGMDQTQASCYAEKAGNSVEGEIYNYIARLMGEGLEERKAVNKARRKFGADFKTPLEEARDACVK